MKATVTFLLWVYLIGCGIASEAPSLTSLVRERMGEIAAGKFRSIPSGPVSGWFMTNETGQVFHRSVLQAQGKEIIAVGADAVPELVKWLSHTHMHVRYIAHYCLEQITSEEPFFPHFATLKQLRSEGYLKEAVKRWSEWYAKNKNPNQPHAANSRRTCRWKFECLAVADAER
jgi:hypothetical protein